MRRNANTKNPTPAMGLDSPDVDAFIQGYPPEIRNLLAQLREVIRRNAPDAIEKISYGIPTFELGGNLVHFSGYARYIGFYPGAEGIAAFAGELSRYIRGKGSVRFPVDEPLPLELIARIVRFRVGRNLEKRESGRGAMR